MIFDFHLPTRIVFGRDGLTELGSQTREWGNQALIVCGRHAMRSTGILSRALDSLASAGVRTGVYDGISANPRSDEVDEAARIARDTGTRVLIGLGGGSAMDAAKAIAVSTAHGPVGPLVGRTLAPHRDALPVIAVPTTAGSGAEVTKGAIITDVERGFKSGIRGDDLFPKVALIDPGLSDTLPSGVAIESGFDALAHAVEGHLARRSSPVNKEISERAIHTLVPALRRLAAGDTHTDVQDAMALGAVLGGINVATASTCLPHRMQQAMGTAAEPGPSHGRGLALLYPAWLEVIANTVPWKLTDLASVFGRPDVHHEIASLLKEIGLDQRLRDFGYHRDDLLGFVSRLSGNLDNDPHTDPTPDLALEIYRLAY
ncbi:iron-containing alcohol dehydrogenase [Streptomyces sp. NPDC053728]|uniref:iron-containing alcohol dehydrogenase n=1 Tax=Streptomyces sp. NPDC053728 TaxID=3155534 RepID=UPI00343D8902